MLAERGVRNCDFSWVTAWKSVQGRIFPFFVCNDFDFAEFILKFSRGRLLSMILVNFYFGILIAEL